MTCFYVNKLLFGLFPLTLNNYYKILTGVKSVELK